MIVSKAEANSLVAAGRGSHLASCLGSRSLVINGFCLEGGGGVVMSRAQLNGIGGASFVNHSSDDHESPRLANCEFSRSRGVCVLGNPDLNSDSEEELSHHSSKLVLDNASADLCVFIVSTRHIKKNEFIYVNYGSRFVTSKLSNILYRKIVHMPYKLTLELVR